MNWDVRPITREHDRGSFRCGIPALDEFIQRYARQNQEEDIGRTWVASPPGGHQVAGFYTLSAASVAFDHFPDRDRRRIPKYPVPVAHLGRLAVDLQFQGRGLGETLLLHALEQVDRASAALAVRAIEVRAKDDVSKDFYLRYGFVPLLDDPQHLYLSMKVVRALFGR